MKLLNVEHIRMNNISFEDSPRCLLSVLTRTDIFNFSLHTHTLAFKSLTAGIVPMQRATRSIRMVSACVSCVAISNAKQN